MCPNLTLYDYSWGIRVRQLSFVLNGNNTEIKVVATDEIVAIVNNVNPDVFDLTDFGT